MWRAAITHRSVPRPMVNVSPWPDSSVSVRSTTYAAE